MDQRTAFARARRYLNYLPAAKWLALLAAVGASILYVVFLFLLGLFADLIVNHGDIPSFRQLPPPQRAEFLEDLNRTTPETWRDRLTDAPGITEHTAEKITTVMTAKTEQLSPEDRVLRKKWQGFLAQKWQAQLRKLGFGPKEIGQSWSTNLVRLALRENEAGLSARDRELRHEILWCWHVYEYLYGAVGEEAAELYRGRLAETVRLVGPDVALDREVADCGSLGLVVRIQYRADGPLTAWLTWLCPWSWDSGSTSYLIGLLIVAVLLGLLRAGLKFTSSYAACLAAIEAGTRLRRGIYHHTHRLGTLAFRALGPSEAVSVSTRHLEAVQDGLQTWLTVYFREPVKFGLLLLFALMVNPWITLAFLMSALLVWLIGGQLVGYFRHRSRRANRRAAQQLAFLQESMMLMRLVKIYLMELFNQNRVERQLSRYARAQRQRHVGEAIYIPLLGFLGLLACLLLLVVIGWVVLQGQLGVASVMVLATAILSLYLPLQTWLDNLRVVWRARESAVVLFEFLDRPSTVGQGIDNEFLPGLTQNLEFDNVVLKEPGTGKKLLQGVTMTIRAGQRVALVGPEEMEKHALVYLISRFLDPTSGEIRIDRRNLRSVTLDSLRAQVAMVMQHNLVFNDTVANNIGCGDPSYPLPRIMEAAKLAHAHQFIQKLPQGYETRIGELGESLTVSRQFRIALARAILRDPALLVIEEPLIPLDEDSKDLIDDTLARFLPGRTVLFLAHRLSTIRNADRVYLLYEGKIADSGDHRHLLAHNDLYRHLQYLEFNEYNSSGMAITSGSE